MFLSAEMLKRLNRFQHYSLLCLFPHAVVSRAEHDSTFSSFAQKEERFQKPLTNIFNILKMSAAKKHGWEKGLFLEKYFSMGSKSVFWVENLERAQYAFQLKHCNMC